MKQEKNNDYFANYIFQRVYLLDDSVAKNAKQKQKQKLPVMIVFLPLFKCFR